MCSTSPACLLRHSLDKSSFYFEHSSGLPGRQASEAEHNYSPSRDPAQTSCIRPLRPELVLLLLIYSVTECLFAPSKSGKRLLGRNWQTHGKKINIWRVIVSTPCFTRHDPTPTASQSRRGIKECPRDVGGLARKNIPDKYKFRLANLFLLLRSGPSFLPIR